MQNIENIDEKIEKYGFCNTILIEKIFDEDSVILLQNAFPTLEKYIDHPHMTNGKALKVIDTLKTEKHKKEIYKNFIL